MFASSVLKPLTTWKKGDHLEICIGIDIGGSGLRTRISNAQDIKEYVDLAHIRAQGTKECYEVFNNLNNALVEICPDYVCKGAALAVAGPINKGVVVLTNWPGDPEVRTVNIDDLNPRLFPKHHTMLLNDLEAGAYGIIAADDQKILPEYFEQLWPHASPKGPIVSDIRTAVLAMGSGLGVALIVKTELLDEPLVLPTECGHLQIPVVCKADPTSTAEYEMIQHVSQHYYGGSQTPEYEDIASGRGLCLAYQFLKMKATNERIPLERINAGDIAEQARLGDKIAKEALTWHYKIFMRSVKAVLTSLNCDSAVLALDNQVKNSWFVSAIADTLHDEFFNFIRPDWVKNKRVYTQKQILNFNILGTDYMAHKLARKE